MAKRNPEHCAFLVALSNAVLKLFGTTIDVLLVILFGEYLRLKMDQTCPSSL